MRPLLYRRRKSPITKPSPEHTGSWIKADLTHKAIEMLIQKRPLSEIEEMIAEAQAKLDAKLERRK